MTISKDDEKRVRERLEYLAAQEGRLAPSLVPEDARTILALLDRPRMPRPEEVPLSVWGDMARTYDNSNKDRDYAMKSAYEHALYDHYNPPPAPVKVEAWGVKVGANGPIQWAFPQRADAERLLENESKYATRKRDLRIVHLVEAEHD